MASELPETPRGAVDILVGLSGGFGGVERSADGLLVLREDIRDPVLHARGARWKSRLCTRLDVCFTAVPAAPEGIGLILATQWQGALLWWSSEPTGDVRDHVEQILLGFLAAILTPQG